MILQALTRYYDILLKDPESEIAPPGYSSIGISYALDILADGSLNEVIPLVQMVQRGKVVDEKPLRMIVPEQVKRSVNIEANFLWDNCVYVLGITDKVTKDSNYARKRFEAFRKKNLEILSDIHNPAGKAITAFLEMDDPAIFTEDPRIKKYFSELVKGGNLVFRFNGEYIHKDKEIDLLWKRHKTSSDSVVSQCLVTGEIGSIARLHPSIKGIRDANPTGASLVSFNDRAYESYNKIQKQGLNSPVSEEAAFAYTTALNYLLSSANDNKKFIIGDATVVYWAESESREFARAFQGLCEPEEIEVIDNESHINNTAQNRISQVANKVRRVQVLDTTKILEGLDGNPRFYVLGLSPNAARISVRFFHSDPFDKIVQKIMRHYDDLKIVKEYEDQHDYLTIQDILRETISPKSTDKKPTPLLAGALFRAILENSPYPAALYYAIINRVRADQDDKFSKKINYTRAAIIKAYLLRKFRYHTQNPIQEVLVMSLNEQSDHPAYLLGRLFAVLEKVQQEAIGDVNASIKDRYFTSACASPASVFPILLRLSQHHISKVNAHYHDKRIEDILNRLDIEENAIPAHLSLDDQGAFILGYYHQRKDLWTSRKSNNSNISENS